MAKVTNLKIAVQGVAAGTYYASWDFTETKSSPSSPGSSSGSGTVRVGDTVTVKSGATWYNGVAISSWVFGERWYVVQVNGSRAVLGKNVKGTHNIQSAINTKYLSGGSGSSSSGSTSTVTDMTKYLDHYEVRWYYDTGNNIWFAGTETNVERKSATYSPPSNAIAIKVGVKPVSKTYEVNGKETSYWTGTFAYAEYKLSGDPPNGIGSPSVDIDKFTLTATVDNITDSKIDQVQFQVYDGDTKYKSGTVDVKACRAVYSCSIEAGGNYRVRCRAVNVSGTSTIYGEWSDFTGESSTIPTGTRSISVAAESVSSVRVSWRAVDTATRYEVEYSVDESYFDSASEVSSITVTSTTAYITGLEAREWFFRVRAVNDVGNSAWSDVVSIVIGKKPSPPTTWSATTTAILGENVNLYWVHNSEDGSKQSKAQIQFEIAGKTNTVTIEAGSDAEDKEEGIYTYLFDSSNYDIGTTVLWKVRTMGVIDEYSDWSAQRTIKLYAPPTLSLGLSTNDDEVLETLPLNITAKSGPVEQTPISYHVVITANNSYETEDVIGSPKVVVAGSEVYSKIFNSSKWDELFEISAGDIMLENGQSYTVKVTVAMNSGLTAEETAVFTTNWIDSIYEVDASVSVDTETLSCYISPFCVDTNNGFPEDATLAVYRREYDGSFTEIAKGLKNDGVVTVTDPHPSLDYARYRIVAQDTNTSNVTFEDLPGIPIGEPSIVIQWDEDWENFDYTGDDEPAEQPWNGSMLKLPYNVDTSEKYDNDVALIEYIGRRSPVSYYGTQRGESVSLSTEFDKRDKETLYTLRRLAAWMGDVYVREPSGIGYWAQITVSMSVKHLAVTIPVTLEVKRVEGGV